MFNFRKLRLATQLILMTALLFVVIIASISFEVKRKVERLSEINAGNLSKETAQHYANVIKAELDAALNEAHGIAKIFESTANVTGFRLTRRKANLMLKYFMQNSPSFSGVYVAFDANRFDGKDANFADDWGHDGSGRFTPYWSPDEDTGARLRVFGGERQTQIYQTVKQRNRESIAKPFWGTLNGSKVLMTSLIVPILDNKAEFIGVSGIDLPLHNLQKFVENIKMDVSQQAYARFYAADGTLVASKNTADIGKTAKQLGGTAGFADKVLGNNEFMLSEHSDYLNAQVLTVGVPVEIGNTGQSWVVTVSIPQNTLKEAAEQTVMSIIGTGGIVLLLAMLAMYFFAKLMSKPLENITHITRRLAQGDLQQEITVRGNHEINMMGNAFREMSAGLNKIVSDIKEVSQELARGNMDKRFQSDFPGDFAEIKQASNDMAVELQSMIRETSRVLAELSQGNMAVKVEQEFAGDFGEIKSALDNTALKLSEATEENTRQNWLKSGQSQLSETISGEQELLNLAENIINFLAEYLQAQVGAVYLAEQDDEKGLRLKMFASHAYVWRKNAENTFRLGEGIVGQAALERKTFVITNAPEDHIAVRTGLGESVPREILVAPFLYEDKVKGIVELASFERFNKLQLELLGQLLPVIAIAVNTAESRSEMQKLLRQTQAQAKQLQGQTAALEKQQADLQEANEKLVGQSEELQAQSEELQAQAEELRQTNEELEQRTQDLEKRQVAIQQQNVELEQARSGIETKAAELEMASKYKSEFLANMSHELRTPLNSLLILSQLLSANKDGNLTQKQVDSARTIHSAGSDLLKLINEILDLSKVEAGKIELSLEEIELQSLKTLVEEKFIHMADDKGLKFSVEISPDIPATLINDEQRLNQIINNLISNAFKFTDKGGTVKLHIHRPSAGSDLSRSNLVPAETIALSVSDSGIGIPQDKQKLIFEAFQQADGTTSRKYGGTGLGLSISRQLAKLMGGEIQLSSKEGKGTTFTVYLPEHLNAGGVSEQGKAKTSAIESDRHQVYIDSNPFPSEEKTENASVLNDDREKLKPGDKSILVIEDDAGFAGILIELAREKGFLCLHAGDGVNGWNLAKRYQPSAIILDIGLPEVDGWSVMEQLKEDPQTRHIPVHFISGSDEQHDAKRMGAIGYLLKPVNTDELNDTFRRIEKYIDRTVKHILLLADDEQHRQDMERLLAADGMEIHQAETLTQTKEALQQRNIDCLVLDIHTGNDSGINLLEQLKDNEKLAEVPVILYAERELSQTEEKTLKRCESELIIKEVYSRERLLDEATLFLHQVESGLSAEQRQILHQAHDKERILSHKKVLLVDDDVRNTFALASILEEKNMDITIANNGYEALRILDGEVMDIVLMDIMMPEMDGYEAMRKIRGQERYRKLPIIALTAKAMKGDRNKCIDAGANDYLSKPIDPNKLLSLMRVWLYR